MPKIRPAGASLADALKHLRVFQARISNSQQDQDYARKITEAVVNIQVVQKDFPVDENDIGSYSNEEVNVVTNLIKKEQKKNITKIPLMQIVKSMYNATSTRDALNIGVQHGITQEQIKLLIIKAPSTSNLGKVIAKLKPAPIPQTPIAPAVIAHKPPAPPKTPIVFEEDEEQSIITNDSDDDILAAIGGK